MLKISSVRTDCRDVAWKSTIDGDEKRYTVNVNGDWLIWTGPRKADCYELSEYMDTEMGQFLYPTASSKFTKMCDLVSVREKRIYADGKNCTLQEFIEVYGSPERPNWSGLYIPTMKILRQLRRLPEWRRYRQYCLNNRRLFSHERYKQYYMVMTNFATYLEN